MERLPNDWTDWDQIMRTYADGSGNEHRLKKHWHHETLRLGVAFNPGLSRGNICGLDGQHFIKCLDMISIICFTITTQQLSQTKPDNPATRE